MVAGHLEVKRGLYYCVVNYTDDNVKRKLQWVSTGLTEKGNKKRAEAQLQDVRRTFQPPADPVANAISELAPEMLFADYMLHWLEIVKVRIKLATYSSYCMMVKKKIAPYFREKGIFLCDLEARHIQQFYSEQLAKVKSNTVIHLHSDFSTTANIYAHLDYSSKVSSAQAMEKGLSLPGGFGASSWQTEP